MTLGVMNRPSADGRSPSPVHVHVEEQTPVHVHIERGKRQTPSVHAVDDYIAPRINRRGRQHSGSGQPRLTPPRSKSPPQKTRNASPSRQGPWIPPPARTSKGKRSTSPTWNADEDHLAQTDQYERRIGTLINEMSQLKGQLEIERQQELLEASRQVLQGQEKEIAEFKKSRESSDEKAPDATLMGHDEEALIRQLVDTELAAQAASSQAQRLFDLLPRLLREGRRVSLKDVEGATRARDELSKRLDEFDASARTLRGMLRTAQEAAGDRVKLAGEKTVLVKRVQDMDELHNRMEMEQAEKDHTIGDLRMQLTAQRDENLTFASTQESLESTKAHLQKQLRQKEADCNRLSVQVRSLEQQVAQSKLEEDRLTEMVRQARERSDRDKEALKKATRAQKQRAGRAEEALDQLTAQLVEKESLLVDLQVEVEDSQSRVGRFSQERNELVAENSHLRGHVTELEERVNQTEDGLKAKLEATAYQANEKSSQLSQTKQENERLRGMAAGVEGRLTQADGEISALRASLTQYEALLAEYRTQSEGQADKLHGLYDRMQGSEEEKRRLMLRLEETERRCGELEAEKRELSSCMSKRESAIEDTHIRLEDKTRENGALMRQLEAALTDARRQNEVSREKTAAKERQLQSRLHELEAQLAQMKAELARARREKEEADRIHAARLQDLKVQLEQSSVTNRSMQTYVQFLKKSYSNVFGEMPGSTLSPDGGPGLNGINFSRVCQSPSS